MKNKKIVIGYKRVSSEDQRDYGYSLNEQENLIIKYYDKNFDDSECNIMIIDDGGYSALNLDRPGIRKIMRMVELDLVEAIIFTDQNRLSRELLDIFDIMKVFTTHNVKVCCIFKEIETVTADGEFRFGLDALLDKRESRIISERTIRGLDGKARSGIYPYGKLPLGIRKSSDGQLYHTEDIEIVKCLYDMYVIRKQPTCDIEHFIKNNYKHINIKLTNGYITKMLNNSLYRGYFERKTQSGETIKVNIIEPVFSENDIINVNTINIRYKNKTKNNYSLRNKVYFENGKVLNHCKQTKILSDGTTAIYKYYYLKNEKIYINENDIVVKLKQSIQNNLGQRQYEIEKKQNEIDDLLLNNDIDINHYRKLKMSLARKCNLKNQFRKIVITKNKEIEVVF